MSAEYFTIKILTPAGLVLEERVREVKLPSSQGEIGILPHHVKYTGLLGVGILEYSAEGAGEKKRLVVCGGFCTFSNDTLTLLTDAVDLPENVDRSLYAKNRDDLRKLIQSEDTQTAQWLISKEKLSRIEALDTLLASEH